MRMTKLAALLNEALYIFEADNRPEAESWRERTEEALTGTGGLEDD